MQQHSCSNMGVCSFLLPPCGLLMYYTFTNISCVKFDVFFSLSRFRSQLSSSRITVVRSKRFTRPPPKICHWPFRMGPGVEARAAAWASRSEAAPAWVATWRYRPVTSAPPSSSDAWAATWPSLSACRKTLWTFLRTTAACSSACTAAHATSSSRSTRWAARASSHACKAQTPSWDSCGLPTRSTRWSGPRPSVERLCRWKTFTFSPVCSTCWPQEIRSFPWQPMALWRTWRRCRPVNWDRTLRGLLGFSMEAHHRRRLQQEPACSHSSFSFCCSCKKINKWT